MNLSTAFRSHAPLMRGLIALYGASGTLHLVHPQTFEPMIPRQLPAPRTLVLVSGVAELACAAGLLDDRTRRVAGAGSAVLLAALLPAHTEMARHAHGVIRRKGSTPKREAVRAATMLRVVGQLPLIKVSLDVARGQA